MIPGSEGNGEVPNNRPQYRQSETALRDIGRTQINTLAVGSDVGDPDKAIRMMRPCFALSK